MRLRPRHPGSRRPSTAPDPSARRGGGKALGCFLLATATLLQAPVWVRAQDLLAEPDAWRLVPDSDPSEDGPHERVVAAWDFEAERHPRWQTRIYRGEAGGGPLAEAARGGRLGLALSSGDQGADADLQVHLPVDPSRRYRLEGFLRGRDLEPLDARVHGTLYIAEFPYVWGLNADNNDPTRWHTDLPALDPGTGDWTPIVYRFATAPTTRMLRIAASLGNWGATRGTIHLDDLRLVEELELAALDSLLIATATIAGESRFALFAAPGTELRRSVDVPEAGMLSFGYGIEAGSSGAVGDGLVFEVALRSRFRTRTLFSRHLQPPTGLNPAAWHDARVSLAPFAGRRVELIFRTLASPAGGRNRVGDHARWSSPRVWAHREASRPQGEPDIVLLTIDTLRSDHLGCYGYARDTSPHLDELAGESILFENVFTPVPRTSPAVASLLTGLYPRSHGLRTLVDALATHHQTLAEYLDARGYTTGAFVTQNLARRTGLAQGFDTFVDHDGLHISHPGARAERIAAKAMKWLERTEGEKRFLWLHVWDPHFTYEPPPPFDRWFVAQPPGSFDLYERIRSGALRLGDAYFHSDLEPIELQHAIDLYDGEIRYVDEIFGEVLEALRRSGRFGSSLIVVTSDHGESLGEHGYSFEHGEYLYDGTLRVPLMIKLPSGEYGGRRAPWDVSLIDVMPTLLEAVGISAEGLQGSDLVRALREEKAPRDEIFAETGRSFFAENPRRYLPGLAGHWTSLRDERWKLIRIPKPDGDDHELYDLQVDPRELHDLYSDDRSEAKRLKTALERWLTEERLPRESPPALADETQARLRALGYLD